MGWKDAKKTADESSGGNYIKFKAGDRKQVVIMGEPVTFFSVFNDKNEYSKQVPGSAFKFKVQAVEINGHNLEGKILSQGSKMLNRIAYLDEEMGGIENKILLISRDGATKDDTTYNVDIKGQLSSEQMAKIKLVKLPSLERKESLPDSPDDIPPPNEEDFPF